MDFSFPKSEKLKSRKTIEGLFKSGQAVSQYPIRAVFMSDASVSGKLAGVSVAKRNFKKAVDRNLLKRRLRESYRLEKHQLELTTNLAVMFIYTAREILPSAQIREAMVGALRKIHRQLEKPIPETETPES